MLDLTWESGTGLDVTVPVLGIGLDLTWDAGTRLDDTVMVLGIGLYLTWDWAGSSSLAQRAWA